MRIGPDLRREQVAPDSAHLSAADPQRVRRQRRRECVGPLKKPAARPQQLETGLDDGSLSLRASHLIGRLETTVDNRSTWPARYWPIRAALPSITVVPGKSRRSTAAKLGSCSIAMMRSRGQPARTRPRVRLPVPAPSSRTGPGFSSSTKRARASARWGPLGFAAAIRSGFCSQRPKKTAASAAMPSPTPDRDLRIILAVVCYSFSNPHMWAPFAKTSSARGIDARSGERRAR